VLGVLKADTPSRSPWLLAGSTILDLGLCPTMEQRLAPSGSLPHLSDLDDLS